MKFFGKFRIFLENLEKKKFGKIWGNLNFSGKFVKFGIFLENLENFGKFEFFWKICKINCKILENSENNFGSWTFYLTQDEASKVTKP